MKNAYFIALAIIAATACNKESRENANPANAPVEGSVSGSTGPAGGPQGSPEGGVSYDPKDMPKPTPAHQRVMDKLNSGMLRIPAVAMKSHQMMSEIGKNGVTIAGQAIIFDQWLDEYAASHPAEMARAKAEQKRYGGLPDVKEGVIVGPGGPEFGGAGRADRNGASGANTVQVPVRQGSSGIPQTRAPAAGYGGTTLPNAFKP